jgi:hypothetical protein
MPGRTWSPFSQVPSGASGAPLKHEGASVGTWQNGSSHNKIERSSLISQAFRLEYVTFAPNGCAWQAAVPFETKGIER